MSAPSELTLELRESNWDRLGSEHFDILIIGGGSVGVGAALDAATRGLKVAMVEARDLACGSSSRSSKMFHGGLRYLQPNPIPQFGLVAESLHERELSMHTLAPHLVKPLKFIYPLTTPFFERIMMFCGFTLYDRMGGAKTVPMQKHFTRKSILKKIPSLKPKATCGGVQYYDTLVDDARHTMMVARTAAKYGAVIRTSTQVIDFIKEGDRVVGVTVKDTEDGRIQNVKASAVINATGVWTDEMQNLSGAKAKFHVHQSKGIHIVLPKDRIKSDSALCFVTEKSVLFVIPWGNYWIVGTTDTSYKLDLAHPAATKTDIDYVLEELNSRLQEPVSYADIVGVYAGLRPLVAQAGQQNTEKLARNHEVARLCPGLVSVAGGKYTTYRVIGKDAVEAAIKDVPGEVAESTTEETPIIGADGYWALTNQVDALAAKYGMTADQIDHLLNRYGSLIFDVLSYAKDDESLKKPITNAEGYLRAEAVYAAAVEGALHLEDVITRRTRISIEYDDRGMDSAQEIADLIAPVLGWDDATKEKEVKLYRDRVVAELNSQKAITDEEADALRNQADEVRPAYVDDVDEK